MGSNAQSLDIDAMLALVGDYGRFQKLINIIFCIMMFPSAMPVLITYFAVQSPPWRCTNKSAVCNTDDIYPTTNKTR